MKTMKLIICLVTLFALSIPVLGEEKLPQAETQRGMDEAAVEAEKRAIAHFDKLAKEERPIRLKEGVQVIDLPPAEKAKFLKVACDKGWKDVLAKSPQVGAKLRELFTKRE
jgi:TRAP-type C4-dicarboxylate transport system substrate-binding protein